MDTVPCPEFFYQTIADEFEGLDNPHDIARRLQVVFDGLLAGTDLRGRRVLDAGCGSMVPSPDGRPRTARRS